MSGGTERPPPWIHSNVLGTRLERKSVYESSCIEAKLEVSGGHIIRALVVQYTMVNFANNKLVRANYVAAI